MFFFFYLTFPTLLKTVMLTSKVWWASNICWMASLNIDADFPFSSSTNSIIFTWNKHSWALTGRKASESVVWSLLRNIWSIHTELMQDWLGYWPWLGRLLVDLSSPGPSLIRLLIFCGERKPENAFISSLCLMFPLFLRPVNEIISKWLSAVCLFVFGDVFGA